MNNKDNKDMVKLEKPYNTMDVANYVVQHFIDRDHKIPNLLLLKILYYLQADSLRQNEEPLFDGEIEKWGYGPVEPEVYSYFKSYGAAPIDSPAQYVEIDENGSWQLIDPINRQLQEQDVSAINKLADEIYDKYKDKPFQLVRKTHEEPMWREAESEIRSGKMHITYNNEEIRKYFSNPENWPWDN